MELVETVPGRSPRLNVLLNPAKFHLISPQNTTPSLFCLFHNLDLVSLRMIYYTFLKNLLASLPEAYQRCFILHFAFFPQCPVSPNPPQTKNSSSDSGSYPALQERGNSLNGCRARFRVFGRPSNLRNHCDGISPRRSVNHPPFRCSGKIFLV